MGIPPGPRNLKNCSTEVAAKVPFRRVQFVSSTMYFTLQEPLFLHFVFAQFVLAIPLPYMNTFSPHTPPPHHITFLMVRPLRKIITKDYI